MNQSQPAKVHRFVEALYDIESGKTIVRHPNKENQWLECTLLNSVVEGRLVASVSGHDQCEIFSVPPIGKPAPLNLQNNWTYLSRSAPVTALGAE